MTLKRLVRIGDSAAGTCTAHTSPVSWTGVFTTGSGGFTIGGIAAVCQGDTGITSCGHTFRFDNNDTILTGLGGKKMAREGDPVIVVEGGSGIITSGSSIVSSV